MADGQGDGGDQWTEPTACGSVACGSVWEVGNVETVENPGRHWSWKLNFPIVRPSWESSNRVAALAMLDEDEERIVPESPPPTRSEKERIVTEPFVRGTSSEKKKKGKKKKKAKNQEEEEEEKKDKKNIR